MKTPLLSVLFLIAVSPFASASLIGFNAEDGSSATTTASVVLGSDFDPPQTDGLKGSLGGKYLTAETDGAGESPGSIARIATYTVNFSEAGTYDLYARVLISANANDDSFFYGNGFGTKSATLGTDWIHVNQLFGTSAGQIGAGKYAWINLSKWKLTEVGVTFAVGAAGNKTFQIGGRENGLWIDAFAFGTATSTFTGGQLNAAVDASFQPSARAFIIGDSTVSTYNASATTQTGWGQVIFHYFENSVEFINHADPGESTKTFYNGAGFWPVTRGQLAAGDYLFIQFGHNDSHDAQFSESTTPAEYKINLQKFIDEARAKGGFPVLVSPMYRRNFVNGFLVSYNPSPGQNDLAPYAAAMQEVANAAGNEGVPFIDLFTASGVYMQALGDTECAKLLQPGDPTHWNRKGATAMAAMVARGVAATFPTPTSPPKSELSQYVRHSVLDRHAADIDSGLTALKPIFTLERQGAQLWLDWFLQPSGVTLERNSDLGSAWTVWNIGAGAASGGDGLVRIQPTALGIRGFFRLAIP